MNLEQQIDELKAWSALKEKEGFIPTMELYISEMEERLREKHD